MAKAARLRPPRAMVERQANGRLAPITAYDEVIIRQAKRGATYELVPVVAKRSEKQWRLYWSILHAVVDATEVVPTAEHLHEQLVRACGFVHPVLNVITGTYEESRDSTAFSEMSPEDANTYMTTALAELSQALGIDVMELLPERTDG